jgi:hypothetical protein
VSCPLGGFVIAMVFASTALAEPPHTLEYRTIALNGNKGGTLAIVDGQPKQEQIEKGRFKYKAYRPDLAEKPGPRTNLYIFIDGP